MNQYKIVCRNLPKGTIRSLNCLEDYLNCLPDTKASKEELDNAITLLIFVILDVYFHTIITNLGCLTKRRENVCDRDLQNYTLQVKSGIGQNAVIIKPLTALFNIPELESYMSCCPICMLSTIFKMET